MPMVSVSLLIVALTLSKSVSVVDLSVLPVRQRESDGDRLQLLSRLQKQEMNITKKPVFMYQSAVMVVSFMIII